MSRKSFENKTFQNPDFHNYWAEYFPRVVRMGVLGAIAVSAAVLIHDKFFNKTEELAPVQDQTEPNDHAV